MNPSNRLTAEQAMKHKYFSDLSSNIFELPDGNDILLCSSECKVSFINFDFSILKYYVKF